MCEAKELVSRLCIVPEGADQGAGDRLRVLLLDAAHHHAHVHRLNYDADTAWLQDFADRLSDLIGKPFLDLKAPCEHFNQPRQLREPNDTARRDVCDMGFPKEWQQVVLTQRV